MTKIDFYGVTFTFYATPINSSEKTGPTLWIDGCDEDPYGPGWCELDFGDVQKLRDFLNKHYGDEK